MVKKVQKASRAKDEASASLRDSSLAQAVRASAQQIWLAGMGAFSKARRGRLGAFESLIKEGASLQRKTQSAADDKAGEVGDRLSAMAGDVSARAGQHWDKLEAIFEQRTAKALTRLGVPTAKDVDTLIKRVDELAAAVQRLSKAPVARTSVKVAKAAKATAPARAAAPAKAAAKKAAKRAARSTSHEPSAD